MPRMPTCSRLALMSSSVNGFTIAVISFILFRLYFVAHSIKRAFRQTGMRKDRAGSLCEFVTTLCVLSFVDTGRFCLGSQTQPNRVFEYQGNDKSADGGEAENTERTDRLSFQLIPSAAVEQALRHARDAVDGGALRGGKQTDQQR